MLGCPKPDLRENIEVGMDRQNKILDLMIKWYKTAAQTAPPPATDSTVLSYNSSVTYYYTQKVQDKPNIEGIVTEGLKTVLSGLTGVVIPSEDICAKVAASLAETTKNQTSEGYSTCVLQTYNGEFDGKKCLYKPLVVAVSFNFPSDEYKTNENVAAFGYWIYLLCTARPFKDSPVLDNDGFLQLTSVHAKPIGFKIPDDMDIVGQKYMTVEELDKYHK